MDMNQITGIVSKVIFFLILAGGLFMIWYYVGPYIMEALPRKQPKQEVKTDEEWVEIDRLKKVEEMKRK